MAKITKNTKTTVTNKALEVGFDSNQSYRAEAKMYTDAFLASFGIYVGFYNKINGPALSVEQALWEDSILVAYQVSAMTVRNTNKANGIPKAPAKAASKAPKSTKRLSYEAFKAENGTSVAHVIYSALKTSSEPMSRADLAATLKIRLSTICGQVVPLEEAGLIQVVGSKIDADSNRTVELLTAI